MSIFKRKPKPAPPFVKATLVFDSGESAAVRFADEYHWHDWYEKWNYARKNSDDERSFIHDGADGTLIVGRFLDVEFVHVTHVQGRYLPGVPVDEELPDLFPNANQV